MNVWGRGLVDILLKDEIYLEVDVVLWYYFGLRGCLNFESGLDE